MIGDILHYKEVVGEFSNALLSLKFNVNSTGAWLLDLTSNFFNSSS
jgi:hypothetical protein